MKILNLKKLNYSRPMVIASLCSILTTVIFVFFKIYELLKSQKIEVEQYVIIACAIILFYIILNIVSGFKVDDLMQFYKESIYSFIGLVGVSLLLIYLFVNHSIFSNQDHKWLIKLLAIIYIVLLTILSSVKKIVGIAISQENIMRNEKNN
jgi:multisubunit Na+/H+ antiporter MnhB subunit